ncbi:MAG: glycosyltransferase family 2 protein [Anaerolineales bacterium]|nr:glycosyltransferase family 2 protein [Anaerolineales bacterium]
MQVTAILPAFNEEARVANTVHAALRYADEVIVIDDGSSDNTAAAAEAAGATVIRQPQNMGYIAAIKRGFVAASGDIVVVLDADGEFGAEAIPALVAPIVAGQADMVQGHRNIVPRPSERVLTWLAGLRGPVGDSGTGLRALRTDLARTLQLNGACICGIFSLEVLHAGGRIEEIPIQLRTVAKPRRIAWYHIRQLFLLAPWLFKSYPSQGTAKDAAHGGT